MPSPNRIPVKARKNIANQLVLNGLPYPYYGTLQPVDFFNAIFDLKNKDSISPRFTNAYDDIDHFTNHTTDLENNWFEKDPRINLLKTDDALYMAFLARTLTVRDQRYNPEAKQMRENMLKIYTYNLKNTGYRLVEADDIFGLPVFNYVLNDVEQERTNDRVKVIKKLLDSKYVNTKIDLMNKSVAQNTDLAIGTAKELLETICNSILRKHGKTIEREWNIARLINETIKSLDFKPRYAGDPEKAESSVKKILQGISTIVQGIAELRNQYGSGHGKEAGFEQLDPLYARLLVGVTTEIAILFLTVNGQKTELVEKTP